MNTIKKTIIKLPIPLKNIRRTNDSIGDAITRIRNGYTRMFDSIIIPKSNKILNMLDALVRSGYISHYTDLEDKVQKGDGSETDLTKVILKRSQQAGYFQVFLKYHNSLPAIQNIQRISSPGKRIYFSKKKLKRYAKIQN